MNSLTKMALGLIGQLKPQPAIGDLATVLELPPAQTSGGIPLMDAPSLRQSRREFLPEALAPQMLADLLWAAAGVNRAELGGRTSPSAMNSQEVQLYVALPEGLFQYAGASHQLKRITATDVRRVTGYQDFFDSAPLDFIYVADHVRMTMVSAAQRESYAFTAAGAMAQNVYLFCASAGLATVIRAWFDRDALTAAMGLNPNQQVLLAQTVGRSETSRSTDSA
jgi:SagB-type dehydrogenase family enzyme